MRHRHLLAGLAIAVTAIFSVPACGLDPARIPMPGASVSGPTYRIRIEFANALNLPTQAKVLANGAKIGSLRSVRVIDPTPERPGHIEAEVEISASVRLPESTTAQLRQNTILGDIFIGLTTPTSDSGTIIAPGGTIPIQRTRPPLQVEDLLASLSTFVGGGAIQRFQDIVNQTNAVLPEEKADTARIFDTIGRDVRDVGDHLDAVDRFLDAVQADLAAVRDNRGELEALLSPHGSVAIPADARSLALTLGIVGGLGTIAHALEWLAPLLRAGDAAAAALVPLLFGDNPLDLSAPSNLNKVVTLLHDKVIPFAERGPKVNITGTQVDGAATGDETDRLLRALRMIGIVR
ncbi:MlaD family protein [Nocardia brasiliensis]